MVIHPSNNKSHRNKELGLITEELRALRKRVEGKLQEAREKVRQAEAEAKLAREGEQRAQEEIRLLRDELLRLKSPSNETPK